MSTVNLGNNIIKLGLAFNLDSAVSAGYIKTPRQLSNCVAWFDADDLSTITTESGSRNIRYWADKSGSAITLAGGGLTLTKEPLSVLSGLNGRNTIRFDGGDYLSGPFSTSYTEFTIFLVLKGEARTTNYQYPLSINNTVNTTGAFYFDINDPDGTNYAQTLWVYWNSGGSPNSVLPRTSPNTTSDLLQGSPNIITFSHTNASSGTNTIYINGRARTDQANNGTQTITIGGAGFYLFVGANSAIPGGPYYGDICELIIYSRQLSVTEKRQVEYYLSNKWRIPFLQPTLSNVDLINRRTFTMGGNNVPVIDYSYRLNPADAGGSPKTSNFFGTDAITYLRSAITTSITMEAWVKPNSFIFAGSNTDIGAVMVCGGNFYLSIDGNGKFNAFMYGSDGNTTSHQPSATSVTRHAWNHVVWTFDGSYIRWYLNGVLDKTSSSTFTIGIINVSSYLGIGAESNSTYGRMIDGYIGGCRIYGRALSGAEIMQNYEQSKTEFSNSTGLVTSGLVRYYDMDIYSCYAGSGTSLTDLAGVSNAVINNAPTFYSTDPKNFLFVGATNHYFSLNSYISSAATTVIIWARTSNNRFLFLSGQNTSYYVMATDGGGNWYSQNAGSPSYYVDSVASTSPSSPNIYDNQYHMFEMRGIDFSTWTSTNIGFYTSGSSFNFNGNIAAVLIYNRSISSDESLQIYNYFKYRFGK
jgi:hypothetical protein